MTPRSSTEEVYDVVGVGFGPSNLALAIAVDEHNATGPENPLTVRFCERQLAFGWHRGMLLDGATMQVSFLKDLVTMRNPTSDFSFLSYLSARGRLVDFINHKMLFPSRVEFHDYLSWVAARLDHAVGYGREVLEVRPAVTTAPHEPVELLEVIVQASGQHVEVLRTRNLVIAAGLVPRLPPGLERSERVWHSAELLTRLDELEGDAPPRRFGVVGSGQSAAEVAQHLHSRFDDAEIFTIIGRYGYSPADDSPFVNQIFDPIAVDQYYGASPDVRQDLLSRNRSTNYSVVDLELIEELYRRQYQEKVTGTCRLHTLRSTRLVAVDVDDDKVQARVELLLTAERQTLEVDVLVCATGYHPSDPCRVLGDLAGMCEADDDGLLRLQRDYRVITAPCLRAGIYVQGATEHTHGIGSSLLSNTAVRAGELLESLCATRDATPASSSH